MSRESPFVQKLEEKAAALTPKKTKFYEKRDLLHVLSKTDLKDLDQVENDDAG